MHGILGDIELVYLNVEYLNVDGMFWNAAAFDQSLDSWDVSKVTNMYDMFHGHALV